MAATAVSSPIVPEVKMKGTSESYLRTCASAAVPLKPGRVKSPKMISHPPLARAAASVAALWACSNLTEYPALVSSLTISKVSSSESSMTRTFKVVAIHQRRWLGPPSSLMSRPVPGLILASVLQTASRECIYRRQDVVCRRKDCKEYENFFRLDVQNNPGAH